MWFVALDVHSQTTSISIRNSRGVVTRRDVVATTRAALRKALGRVRGKVRVVCESGPMARWVRDTLETRMRAVLVCDRRRSRLAVSKSDRGDADALSELLWKNHLQPVYVPRGAHDILRRFARHYSRMLNERARIVLRLRALFLEYGMRVKLSLRKKSKIPVYRLRDAAARHIANAYIQQLAIVTELLAATRKEFLAYAASFPEFALLQTVPHIGKIRSAQLIAIVADPARFTSLRRFWSYSGVGLIQNTSAEHRVDNGVIVRGEKARSVRLSKACQPTLKRIFRDAALYASVGRGAFRTAYEASIGRGMRPAIARVALARKIAAVVLAVWRSGVPFDSSRVGINNDSKDSG